MKKIGSRAEVYHGNAEKTKGGLTKDDLKINNYGNIVSIKQSNRMGSSNPLRQKGYLQDKNLVNLDQIIKMKPKKFQKKNGHFFRLLNFFLLSSLLYELLIILSNLLVSYL